MLSFSEKRAIQAIIIEQNKILASKPSFTEKRAAQKAKTEALAKLGKVSVKQPSNTESTEITAVDEKTDDQSSTDQTNIDNSNFGLQASGIKTREKINSQVTAITDQIRAGRDPKTLTGDEVALLKQYSGKGGLTVNSQHEYYTPTPVAEGVWDALKINGFENGNVLEPSTGAGVFLATKPTGVIATGTEIDETSATVAQVLNPGDVVSNQSFEMLAVSAPDNSFDAVVGNVPFGNARGPSAHDDPEYKSEKLIERYFVQRTIDKVKPGGLICLVVPINVIGAKGKAWEKFRIAISKKAEFLGGHKLPSKTFAKQGTDVVVDVLVMRKHDADFLARVDDLPIDALKGANVVWDEFVEGRYWQGEGKRFIHGEFVPKDPTKFRDADKVIAGENFTDESLKRALAMKFDSRIDWAALDAQAPIVRNYIDGDRRMINGTDYELQNGDWVKVGYAETKIVLDAAVFGADSVDSLQSLMQSESGVLSLGWGHVEAACDTFPNMVPQYVKDALKFSRIQPDEHQWRAFRGAVIGGKIEAFLNSGSDDENELAELKELILHEVVKYGHPSNVSGLVVAGKESARLGMFINSVDEAGNFSALLESGTIRQETAEYNANDPISIITYLFEQNQDPVELSTLLSMYEGDAIIEDLGDVTKLPGLAVSPEGFIYPFDQYCSGDVFPKLRAMRDAMVSEKDPRVIEQYKKQMEAIDAKRRKTPTEDITFRMRQKWFAQSQYVIEFLASSGYEHTVRYDEEIGEYTAHGKGGGLIPQIVNYLNEKPVMGGVRVSEYKDAIKALEDQFDAFMKSHPDSEDLTNEYNEKFNGYVEFSYANSDLGLTNLGGRIKPHPYQNEAIRRLSREGKGILGFDVGLGKAQPLDAKILTPSGWVLMGDIQVGDLVIAADGSHVPVVGVFPQGEKEIFEVEFSDGSKTRCCDEHLWFTKTEKDRKNERYHARNGNSTEFSGSVKPLSEIRDTLIYQTQKNHAIPIAAPTEFFSIDGFQYISPYVMGVLLGDGCFKQGGVTFTPGDDEIAGYVTGHIAELAGNLVEVKLVKSANNRANTYSISQGNIGGNVENPIKGELRGLGLDGLGSHEKFIPKSYKFGLIEHRASLLRGLMDTDGYVSKDGITVQFTSTSKRLALDVVEIVQSLGGIAWINSKIPTFTHNDEKREGREAFTVSMRMPAEINPFRLKRKADRVKPKTKYKPVRYFTRVESVGMAQAQCIAIDHPDHLYVTDEFIVTHNTFSALALQAYNEQMGRAKRTCIVVPDAVLANWYHEHKAFYKDTSRMLIIGMTPKPNKDGSIQREPILDEKGQPKLINGEPIYQDVIVKDNAETIWAKMHSVPQSDYSLVIMSHSRFGMIPVKTGTKKKYVESMMSRELMSAGDADKLMKANGAVEVRSASGEKRITYSEAVAQDRLAQKYSDEGTKKKDAYPYFEDMGFDSVMVDEAHAFKNSFAPGKESSRIAYLPTPDPSQRAIDMSLKLAHIREMNAGRGVTLLTATPVTNSPLEIYNMLSFMISPEEFEKFGVYTPDDFVRVFADVQQIEKMKVSGDFGMVDAMVGFQNLDGLRSLFHKYAIIKDAEDVKLPLPGIDEVESRVELSDEQSAIYADLRAEAKIASSPNKDERETVRPLFSIIRDMDRTTTDLDMFHKRITFIFKLEHREALQAALEKMPKTVQRKEYDSDKEKDVLITVPFEYDLAEKSGKLVVTMTDAGEDYMVDAMQSVNIPEDEVSHPITPKYAELLKNLTTELHAGGKQIIFIEEKTQHQKLARIIVHHLPITLENIGIINATDAAGEKLQRISDSYNAGKIKIVIANKKAEVGVNLQKGTTAIHHLTFPWVPASMQQRNGRGVRQGNTVDKVNIYYYIGKGSFDLFRLNLINKKGSWINDILRGTESNMESKGDGHLSAEDVMVLLSDNPEEAKARMEEAKAKREAAKKAKADKAMVINLSQLIEAKRKLKLLDVWKADDKAKAEAEIAKITNRLNLLTGVEGEEAETERDNLKRKLKIQERKLEELDAKYAAIEEAAKATIKQRTVFLKSKAKAGELPFDAEVIDNSDSALITRDGKVIKAGQVFEVENKKYDRKISSGLNLVESIDANARTVTFKVKGGYNTNTLSINELHNYSLTPVAMTLEDWGIINKLNKPLSYAEIIALGKPTFDKFASQIILTYGEYYIADLDDGTFALTSNSRSSGTAESLRFVWPDGSSEALKRQVSREYLSNIAGTYYAPKAEKVLAALFGEAWAVAIEQFAETATQEDVLKVVEAGYREMIDTQSSAGDEYAFIEGLGHNASYYLTTDIPAKLIKGIAGDNRQQIKIWASEYLSGRRAWFDEEKARRKAEAAAKAMEDLKNSPDYKEVPVDVLARLSAQGITATYNIEQVYIKRYIKPFSLLMFNDKVGKSGLLYAAKETLKSLFGAQFTTDPSNTLRGPWWYVTADKDIEKIAAIILNDKAVEISVANKEAPEKIKVPAGKVKEGDTVAGFIVKSLGKSWPAKEFEISVVKRDSGFDIEEGDLIQYARF